MFTSEMSTKSYPPKRGHVSLYTGGIAAVLASACHHISFLLATVGVSNSKIIYIVTLADWVRPVLITVAIISLFISYQRIWQTSFAYKTSRNDTNSQANLTDKIFFLFVAMLVISVFMLPYFLPCVE